MNKINIVDVTLRDGGYAVDFQFSCAQQKVITKSLESLGIDYVEIGHGMGLNASSPQNGLALHTDQEYLSMAKNTLQNLKYGMFCIPGIARLEDIDIASALGASFVRIGTNITEVDASEKYIKKAKNNGMLVATNYMKSYAVPYDYFVEQVLKSESYGADIVYIVDSAGCMTPNQIEELYKAIRKKSKIRLGFHGHDNMGLAVWNSLKAAGLGVEFIDCSFQGIGRSSGNTSIEQFVICANKMGFYIDIDVKDLLKSSKKYVYPLCKKLNILDLMCGYSGFHTSYLRDIHKIAGKYGVDPLLLIEKYTSTDQVHLDINRLEEIAKKLPEDLDSFMICDFYGYFGHEQS